MKRMKLVNGMMIALLGATFIVSSCKKEGCTDPLATNYNDKANQDDNSCVYGPIDPSVCPECITELTENITTPTTLVAGNYKVCESITVSAALTVNPGATFTFCANTGFSIDEDASISAVGTAALPIVFKGEVQSEGYWRGLAIYSNNPNNDLDFVTVQDAGSYWATEYSNLYLGNSAKLKIKNSTFDRSEKYGAFIEDDATITTFSNNTFSNNADIGLSIGAFQVGVLDVASNYNTSNTQNYIEVRGGTINNAQTWQATTTPLLFTGNVNFEAAMTINAGVHIKLGSEKRMSVGTSGSITAIGTATNRITIEGQFASAGYGAGLQIQSNNPQNKLNYVNFSDGGSYWAWEYSGVYIEGSGRLEMDNCNISNSNSWGVYVDNSATLISSGVTQTDDAGVMVSHNITGNGAGADADCSGGGCTVYFE